MEKKIAIYPGTFDPITNGHLDIIKRAMKVFDEVYVTILDNKSKKVLFSVDERIELLNKVCANLENVVVDSSAELTVQYARQIGACSLVRGLRATMDFEYELNIFAINNYLDPEIETVFFMTKLENSFISSSSVKEMVLHHASVTKLVDPLVEQALIEKIHNK